MEDTGGISCAFALVMGDDPTYAVIDGAWRDTATPYGTIHRIGSDGTHRGVLHECVEWAARRIAHLRVDTHADNQVTVSYTHLDVYKRHAMSRPTPTSPPPWPWI